MRKCTHCCCLKTPGYVTLSWGAKTEYLYQLGNMSEKIDEGMLGKLEIQDKAAEDSGTEDELVDEVDEQDPEIVKPINGQIIDDEHPEVIEADIDLTADIPLDTTYIELIHLKIRSLADLDLGRFKKVEVVCLRQNLIDSISDIKHYNKDLIEELDFYDNRINHISSHLNEFKDLVNLDLSFNKIKNIKNIDQLTKVENLYFIQNKISEIKNIKTLKSLKNLELGGNKIDVISDELLHLDKIEKLWLGKNRILQIENLTNLTNLKVLSIQSNRISKILGLETLVNLEELYISHNKLTEIEGLENNTKLTVLDITGNKIEKLANLNHLTELTDLWASHNLLDDFDNIGKELKNCKELDTVYFENNPVQFNNQTSYRRKLKLYLNPSLKKIDATYL